MDLRTPRMTPFEPPSGGGSSRVYHANGGGSGVVNIPAGTTVTGIAAFAVAGVTTATVTVNADSPVPVPEGGQVQLSPPYDALTGTGTLNGPATITFTDTSGYGIETVI